MPVLTAGISSTTTTWALDETASLPQTPQFIVRVSNELATCVAIVDSTHITVERNSLSLDGGAPLLHAIGEQVDFFDLVIGSPTASGHFHDIMAEDVRLRHPTAAGSAFRSLTLQYDDETLPRYSVYSDGRTLWGDGGGVDGYLYRDPDTFEMVVASDQPIRVDGATYDVPGIVSLGRLRYKGEVVSTADGPGADYNPSGWANAGILRFTSFTAGRTLSGLAGGTNGDIIAIINNTGFQLTLAFNSASSAAANRFRNQGSADRLLTANGTVLCVYANLRWNIIG